MKKTTILLVLLLVVALLVTEGDAWRRRRRRRRRRCVASHWGNWGPCYASCGTYAYHDRTRYLHSCSGWHGSERQLCYGGCCRVNCLLNGWGNWGGCSASCGWGVRHRTRSVARAPTCGGSPCSSYTFESGRCYSGCCRVNCLIGTWNNWGACSTPSCGSGRKYRYRSITRQPSCGGSGCPGTSESSACNKCCPRNCTVSQWSPYSNCLGTTCGAGYKTRTRSVVRGASCGGAACPSLSEIVRGCTVYNNRDCQVWLRILSISHSGRMWLEGNEQ